MDSLTSLSSQLRVTAESFGLSLDQSSPDLIRVSREAVLSKWFLGGRKADYRASCTLDEVAHVATFREVLKESSWGVPPPAVTVETAGQRGATATKSIRVNGPGGGHVDLGAVRQACERAVAQAGWTFVFEAGKLPA